MSRFSAYEMTEEKIFLPSTEENYNLDDLSSNDETDDEENPRKIVPSWAQSESIESGSLCLASNFWHYFRCGCQHEGPQHYHEWGASPASLRPYRTANCGVVVQGHEAIQATCLSGLG